MPWTGGANPVRMEMTYGGETATIVYDAAKMTTRWLKATQQAHADALPRALVEVVIEWGPLADGTIGPPTLEQFQDVPLGAQVELAKRMVENYAPSSEEKNASSKPSPTTAAPAESSSTDSPSFQNGSTSSQTPSPSPDVSSAPSSS